MENGYAQLRSRKEKIYIKKLAITLGRHSILKKKGTRQDHADINLGCSKNISRLHAKIAYNFQKKLFQIESCHKNGLLVDGKFLKESESANLIHGSEIEIFDKFFVFLLPNNNNNNKSL